MDNCRNNYNLNKVLFAIYLIFVWVAYIIEHYLDSYYVYPKAIVVTLIAIVSVVIIILSNFLINCVSKIQLPTSVSYKPRGKIIAVIIVFCLTFAYFYIWFVAFYPGGFSPDSVEQLGQALSNSYNNWHPVWHTLFSFTFPLFVSGGRFDSIIFFQIIFASASITYLIYTIIEYGGIKFAMLAWLAIILNPTVGGITMMAWKDVAFAYTGAIAFTCVVRIILSKEDAYHSIFKFIFLGIVLGSATLLRHNACLFTIFLAFSLLFIFSKKSWFITVGTMGAFILIIILGVYNIIGVPKFESTKTEKLGLPLTILGEVVVNNPEVLDDEMADYAYSIATQEEWEALYDLGNFNDLKFECADTQIVEDSSYAKTFRILFKCFKKAPAASLRALFALTDIVYGTEDQKDIFIPYGTDNYGLTMMPNFVLYYVLVNFIRFVRNTVFRYIAILGIYIMTIILFILGRSNLRAYSHWRRILPCLSILCYDFGTMFLLTGVDSRFFFITFLICPLVVLLMLSPIDRFNYNQTQKMSSSAFDNDGKDLTKMI